MAGNQDLFIKEKKLQFPNYIYRNIAFRPLKCRGSTSDIIIT